jgi:hypothetical protein
LAACPLTYLFSIILQPFHVFRQVLTLCGNMCGDPALRGALLEQPGLLEAVLQAACVGSTIKTIAPGPSAAAAGSSSNNSNDATTLLQVREPPPIPLSPRCA